MMTIDDDKQKEYWEENHGHRMYDHPVVEFFARQRIEQVAGKWLDLSTIKTALDVGCGDGFSTYYMNQHVEEVHAIDRSNRMLNRHPLRIRLQERTNYLGILGPSSQVISAGQLHYMKSAPLQSLSQCRDDGRYLLGGYLQISGQSLGGNRPIADEQNALGHCG